MKNILAFGDSNTWGLIPGTKERYPYEKICLDIAELFIPSERILLISPILLGENIWQDDKDPEFDISSAQVCKKLKDVYGKIAARRGNMFMAASDIVTASETDDEHLDEEGHKKLAGQISFSYISNF